MRKLDETTPLSKPEVASDTLHRGWVYTVRGFTVRLRLVAAFSMTLGILAATIGLASPVSAAPASWVMPSVRNMVLQQALKAIQEATGSAKLDLRISDQKNGQEVINQSNWAVCAQNPGPGKAISQKTKRIVLYVKRFNQKGCS